MKVFLPLNIFFFFWCVNYYFKSKRTMIRFWRIDSNFITYVCEMQKIIVFSVLIDSKKFRQTKVTCVAKLGTFVFSCKRENFWLRRENE